MNDMRMLIAIVRRKHGTDYLNFFQANDAPMVLSTLCEGTATPSVLEMLGLIQREREMHCLIVPTELAKRLRRKLISQMHIDLPNEGVAFSIPLNDKSLDMETHKCTDEVNTMETFSHSLIIAISEKGHSNDVMDAARAAGAKGGTIVHAKGTGAHLASRFFGISIAEEREMIYIVVPSKDRARIMQAIEEKTGRTTPAQSIVFSLPVEAAVGLHSEAEEE